MNCASDKSEKNVNCTMKHFWRSWSKNSQDESTTSPTSTDLIEQELKGMFKFFTIFRNKKMAIFFLLFMYKFSVLSVYENNPCIFFLFRLVFCNLYLVLMWGWKTYKDQVGGKNSRVKDLTSLNEWHQRGLLIIC